MKIKFWQFEYDFDKEDAKIVIPIILLLVGVSVTEIRGEILVALAALYYVIYFFLESVWKKIKPLFKSRLRCPNKECKSDKIIGPELKIFNQGDELQKFFTCTKCKKELLLTNGGLINYSEDLDNEIPL